MHTRSESTSLSSAYRSRRDRGSNLLSRHVTNDQYMHSMCVYGDIPAEELDLDPISQNKSPVSDRVEGRLLVSAHSTINLRLLTT
jgi:hypothetical protein